MSGFDDDFFTDAFTWMTFKFKTVRIIDNIITAHVNKLKTEVMVKEDCSEQELSIALEKIHFWFDNIVSTSLIFCRDNEFALDMMFDENGKQRTGNFPMVLADDPTDDHLAMVFQSKLNALGDGSLMFSMIEMSSDNRENLTCAFVGHGEMCLPTMEEWVGDRSFHNVPWWARNDGSTLDIIPGPNADLTNPPSFGYDLGFIEKQFLKEQSDAAIIIRPEFKPRVISGGLDDNNDTED
jgi:hypothetical protein